MKKINIRLTGWADPANNSKHTKGYERYRGVIDTGEQAYGMTEDGKRVAISFGHIILLKAQAIEREIGSPRWLTNKVISVTQEEYRKAKELFKKLRPDEPAYGLAFDNFEFIGLHQVGKKEEES